ncbi:hypothetical protein [Endozoicomonas ascidiicola]|uniref:hypothetical protein n=1 Tax=Endozoicomonas ascidiicola TaxID=1698521 RepID=UPI000835FE9A|nr:hypothetical protein [Endozoicomonas ascidiicola]
MSSPESVSSTPLNATYLPIYSIPKRALLASGTHHTIWQVEQPQQYIPNPHPAPHPAPHPTPLPSQLGNYKIQPFVPQNFVFSPVQHPVQYLPQHNPFTMNVPNDSRAPTSQSESTLRPNAKPFIPKATADNSTPSAAEKTSDIPEIVTLLSG